MNEDYSTTLSREKGSLDNKYKSNNVKVHEALSLLSWSSSPIQWEANGCHHQSNNIMSLLFGG